MSMAQTVRQMIGRALRLLRIERIVFNYRYARPKKSAMDELQLAFNLLVSEGLEKLVIDVGAHFGESAYPFLLNGWSVCSFEPDPSLEKHEQLGSLQKRFSKFSLYRDAVSDVDGREFTFYSSNESTGISSLIPFTEGHDEICKTRTITLRRFLSDNAINEIGLLKIDTEGNDLMVLRGFPFETIKPEVIITEFEDSKTEKVGYSYREIGDLLVAQGYVVYLSEWYPIERYGAQHVWRSLSRYPSELQDSRGWGNFLAVDARYQEYLENYCSQKLGVELL